MLPGVTCRSLISRWIYPMIYSTSAVRYVSKLHDPGRHSRTLLRPLREVGSPSRNMSRMSMGCSERRHRKVLSQIEGADPTQHSVLCSPIPKLVCPSQRPHGLFYHPH